ncbi:ATP-binding protein [Streptomyces edwardsiae]|uniref:ATP-binding protein n=1 Tax=Streptomyces edwardsiae TaxID=3075527 RepID=A0ABU2QQC2_9ACTN|nr:ATP-binding protein [Streptomyces sp. DSM 41635]MDT0406222.1 ATP-binding protein [Streptomyces sp. DSM 41635]
MIYHLDGAVIPTGFDVPVEPLRRAAHFTGEPGCIAEARSFAARFLQQLRTEWCAVVDERADGAVLLVVSELVTNADRHSEGPYILELEGTDTALTVTVYDSSAHLPRVFPRDPERVGRHGLEIVRALARDVSVERVPVGKRVCAVLPLVDAG